MAHDLSAIPFSTLFEFDTCSRTLYKKTFLEAEEESMPTGFETLLLLRGGGVITKQSG